MTWDLNDEGTIMGRCDLRGLRGEGNREEGKALEGLMDQASLTSSWCSKSSGELGKKQV